MNELFLPEVLYEDEFLLCINKPAGLLSIRDGYDPLLPHALSILTPHYGSLWIVHRLDRETSGSYILARTAQAHRALNIAFGDRQVHKIYHAIVRGTLTEDEKMISFPLKVNGDRRHRTTINQISGRPAQTKIRGLRSSGGYTLVEAQPLTGYTHQIRAHLLAIGVPILADRLYSLPARLAGSTKTAYVISNLPISRLALHAYEIDFTHPITNLPIKIIAPYPLDFTEALNKLDLI
jgi:tRNA pseudouridine32 synthase / 23S rRNA pseudouridine746 synthase